MTNQIERYWYVKDESADREGYCCLAIREEGTDRLVADLADVPEDIFPLVSRAKREANILALSSELLNTCLGLLDQHEKEGGLFLPEEIAARLTQIKQKIKMGVVAVYASVDIEHSVSDLVWQASQIEDVIAKYGIQFDRVVFENSSDSNPNREGLLSLLDDMTVSTIVCYFDSHLLPYKVEDIKERLDGEGRKLILISDLRKEKADATAL